MAGWPGTEHGPIRRLWREVTRLSETLVERLQEELPRAADPVRAAAMAKYMRDQFPFYGIPSTPLSVLFRHAQAGLPRPSSEDAASFALACWELPEREYQYAACTYLRRHARQLDADFLDTARYLLVTKSWWDTVDALAAHVVGPLLSAYPSMVKVMDDWAAGDEMWLTRAAILFQMRYKRETDAQRLFGYCVSRAGDRDFFIRKAIGWALREYAKTEPQAVRDFVSAHPELSGLSQREALKNIE
jgi:3-methyladenine DNA glycosylase AlkD